MKTKSRKQQYKLYLASGITLWKTYFHKNYSPFFNKKVGLFEPGTLDNPNDHRFIPIGIACYDLNEINHADALLVYMKHYQSLDGSPTGTDSTWECGYAIGKGKPVVMLIEDKDHIDYYASQWMVSFSINAILTVHKEVAEIVKKHPKFVHTTVLLAENKNQFETKVTEYLDNYYRSIYSRSGVINYAVDKRARELFSRKSLSDIIFTESAPHKKVVEKLNNLEDLKFTSDEDALVVCAIERYISELFKRSLSEEGIDSAISAVIKVWNKKENYILDCLEYSLIPPFAEVKNRHSGIKKIRPELFFELYDLVNHHVVSEARSIKSESFPYDIGAVVELYNWMNTYALDDVFDNSEMRQRSKTVWKAFSRRDAIYTGLLGHLLPLKYFFIIATENKQIGEGLAKVMNDYNYIMYQGQVFDLQLTFNSEKKKKLLQKKNLEEMLRIYLQRIYGICGGFFEAIGELSAKAGDKEEQIMNAAEIDVVAPIIGMYYGIIQMIRNDLGDYIIVEEVSGMSKGMKGVSHCDITEGKVDITYLIAMYSSVLDKKEKKFLYESLFKKLSQKQKLKINELLWKSGAIDLTVELIHNIIKHVNTTLLTKYHETPTRTKWMFSLMDITKEVLIPFKDQASKFGWMKYEYDKELLEDVTKKVLSLENKTKGQRLK